MSHLPSGAELRLSSMYSKPSSFARPGGRGVRPYADVESLSPYPNCAGTMQSESLSPFAAASSDVGDFYSEGGGKIDLMILLFYQDLANLLRQCKLS